MDTGWIKACYPGLRAGVQRACGALRHVLHSMWRLLEVRAIMEQRQHSTDFGRSWMETLFAVGMPSGGAVEFWLVCGM
jgi:hypothetical protein